MDTKEIYRAFNLGSDARIHGIPRFANPYPADTHKDLRTRWFEGWNDVNQHWGKWATRPVQALPSVRNGAV